MLGWTTSIPCTLPNFLEYPAWLHIFSGLPCWGANKHAYFPIHRRGVGNEGTHDRKPRHRRMLRNRRHIRRGSLCIHYSRCRRGSNNRLCQRQHRHFVHHKSSDSETSDDSTNFAISDASFNLYKVGQIPASGGATFEPVAPFTDSHRLPRSTGRR